MIIPLILEHQPITFTFNVVEIQHFKSQKPLTTAAMHLRRFYKCLSNAQDSSQIVF